MSSSSIPCETGRVQPPGISTGRSVETSHRAQPILSGADLPVGAHCGGRITGFFFAGTLFFAGGFAGAFATVLTAGFAGAFSAANDGTAPAQNANAKIRTGKRTRIAHLPECIVKIPSPKIL